MSWLDDRRLERENAIKVSVLRSETCREIYPKSCPHYQEAEYFRIRGRMYLVFKPACARGWVGSNGRIKEFALHVEHIFGVHLYSEQDMLHFLDRQYPEHYLKFKEPYSYYAAASYHSSWTAYYSIRDIVPLLRPRPRCLTCGKKSRFWKSRSNYYTAGSYLSHVSKVFCSIDCADKWADDRYEEMKREKQERKSLREGHKLLKEIRAYLKQQAYE